MDNCKECGLSVEGRYENRSLGADEEFIFVKCTCLSTIQRLALVSEVQEEISVILDALLFGDECESGEFRDNTSAVVKENIIDIKAENSTKEYEITMDPNLSRVASRLFEKDGSNDCREVGYPMLVNGPNGGSSSIVRHRYGANSESVVKSRLCKRRIAYGLTYTESIEYDIDTVPYGNLPRSTDFYEVVRSTSYLHLGNWLGIMRKYWQTGLYSCEFEWKGKGEPNDEDVLLFVEMVSSTFCVCQRLDKVFDTSFLSELRASANPVRDVNRVSGENMLYRVKVDGEHNWLVSGGCLWYVCRNDRFLTVVGYIMKSRFVVVEERPSVIRVETLPSGRMFFIDVLSSAGDILPSSRPVGLSLSAFLSIQDIPSAIEVRREISSFEEISEEIKVTDIPNDGIIAIDSTNSLTYRIKPPTVDLKCVNGKLCTVNSGYETVEISDCNEGMIDDKVYECSLSTMTVNGQTSIYVSSYRERFDKVLPNNEIVCEKIFDNVFESKLGSPSVSREIGLIAEDLITVSKEFVKSSRSKGNLVINVMGIGSERDCLVAKDDSVSCLTFRCKGYIHIPKGPDRSLDVTGYNRDSLEILFNKMSSGSVRAAHSFTPFHEFVSDTGVVLSLANRKIPVCYNFSVAENMIAISRLRRFPIPQTGWFYHATESNRKSFNVVTNGVSMKVNWGEKLITTVHPNREPLTERVPDWSSVGSCGFVKAEEVCPSFVSISAESKKIVSRILVFSM